MTFEAWASTQSDKFPPSLNGKSLVPMLSSVWKKKTDQSGKILRLIRVIADCKCHIVGFARFFFVFDLLLYVHSTQLRSCWDSQLF